VLGLPTILGVIVLVVWAVDRYRFGPIKAQVNMKAHVRQRQFYARQLFRATDTDFLVGILILYLPVVFFSYPQVFLAVFFSYVSGKE
jgi:hypothetical protein